MAVTLAFWGDWHQCDSGDQPIRPLLSAGACPGHGWHWPPAAAHGPARRALGAVHPCCRPSVLGHRDCSTALCPWGPPRCCCREKAQVPIKPSSFLLAPPHLHSVSLKPPICVTHRPGGLLVPGLCLSVSALPAGAVLVGVCCGWAP